MCFIFKVCSLRQVTDLKKTGVSRWEGEPERCGELLLLKQCFLFPVGRRGRVFGLLLCMGGALCHYLKFEGRGEERDERRVLR